MNTYSATESYLNLLLSLPNLDPMTVLAVFFLTLARLIPIINLAPFLGSKNVPAPIRIGFSLALIAIFLPQNLLVVHQAIPWSPLFIGYFLKEMLIGVVLGFLAGVPFHIAEMAGSLIDFQRGASSLQVTDPTTQSQTGPIGQLMNFVLIATFFALGGPFIFLGGLADSYRLIPVDAIFNTDIINMQNSFWRMAFSLCGLMMNMATQLAAPALIGILFTDLFLGIANRLAPQVQIVFLGIALKSWVGIALLTASWGMLLQVMNQEALHWFKALNSLIELIGKTYAKSG